MYLLLEDTQQTFQVDVLQYTILQYIKYVCEQFKQNR